MSGDQFQKRPDCQLQVVYEAGERPDLGTQLRHIFLRIQSALRRRTSRMFLSGQNNSPIVMDYAETDVSVVERQDHDILEPSPDSGQRAIFREGEMVKIRSLEEIKATLDSAGRCEGLQFMPGMQKYCGRQAWVMKKVHMMFDERLWKMVKIRHAYILRGIICDGRDVFDGEGCDRSCYFFWKDKWLNKKE